MYSSHAAPPAGILDDTQANVRAVMAVQGQVTPDLMQRPGVLGSAVGLLLIGIGSGRLRADLASCSADIAWYMSKPMKLIAL